MHDDHKTEAEDQAVEDAKLAQIANDAAILVICGLPRQDGIKKANAIYLAQQEAAGDVTGVLATAEEAQSPEMPNDAQSRRQINQIAKELLAELEDGRYGII